MADAAPQGSYNQNFFQGVLEADNPYTAGFGKEKTYTLANAPKEGEGLLKNYDATYYDPTNAKYLGNAWGTNAADRAALASGDYSKIANPDGLSNDLLHFLYKKGAALNLYGLNDFLTKRKTGTKVYDAATAEQVAAPFIAKRAAGKGALAGILGAVAPIALSFIPGVGPILGAAAGAALNASKGNWLGALTSIAGIPGVSSGISSALGLGSTAAQGAITASNGTKYLSGGALSNLKLAHGGQVKGEGDGMSDGIPAVINGGKTAMPTPAALSDGEHVVPALQVALLGRGSSDAGSKKVKDVILKEINKMYGDEIDPVKAQSKAMKVK